MLEHRDLDKLSNSMNESLEQSKIQAKPKQLVESDNSFDDSLNLSVNDAAVRLTDIEKDIEAILKDNKKMANFQRVISCAKHYSQATTNEERHNVLLAIRDSAANYLIQRKSSSNAARKALCEKIIRSIDGYARQNNIAATRDVSYMLDGRHMTYDEIDNEITLAHSLVSDKPLGEVTRERRESFKRKLEDVKTVRVYMADMNKWKNEKSQFLQEKINELNLPEGVNEGYDSVLNESVLWYAKAYNLKDEAMTTMLTRLKTDDDKDNLQISMKARQIETILYDIMSWNMEDFTFGKTEEFLYRKEKGETQRDHFLKLYSKLQVAKNADLLLGELMRLQERLDAPSDFSKKTVDELMLRLKIYKSIEKDYSERLSLMESPYYALLQQPDFEKAMTAPDDKALIALKQGKNIPGMRSKKQVPAEFANYVDKLILKKQRWNETKVSDYFTRYSHIEDEIKKLLQKSDIGPEERDKRLLREGRLLRSAFAGNITELKRQQKLALNPGEKEAPEDPFKEWENIDKSMREVQGRSFIPVQKPESRLGFWGTLKNYGMVGARWMVGATFGVVGTIVGAVLGAPGQLGEKERVENSQKKRRHGVVPGTKDEKFIDEDVTDSDDEDRILFDVRRSPLIWEKLSAEDPDSPPEITIMAQQSRNGMRETNISGMGHCMIGLSYSRFNKATGRKERYKLKMGFYPGGGSGSPTLQLMMAGGAIIHGQIRDDTGHAYTVARKYKVKPGDINRIIRATETYADGGYGFYKRNCATYVTDMAKLANLPFSGEMVEEDIHFKGIWSNAANIATGGAYSAYSLAANNLASKLQKNDKSYQNYGQKMVTKEDLDRYYNTAKNGDVIRKGYSPGVMGEVLRESDKGELSAYNRDVKENEEESQTFREDFLQEGSSLADAIKSRLESQGIKLEGEDQNILRMLVTDEKLEEVIDKKGNGIAGEARNIHKRITRKMKRLNDYYVNRLKSDYNLNDHVMKYLSFCEVALGKMDQAYQANISYDYVGDVGSIINEYDIVHQARYKNKNGEDISVDISPGVYHGYLKMGFSPARIISEAAELTDLAGMEEERTAEQEKRYTELDNNFRLACNFSAATGFSLYKDEYTRKDIDYAFSELPQMEMKKEEGERLSGEYFSIYRASFLLQTVIMEKVLGGMSQAGLVPKSNDINFLNSLDAYMTGKMNEKKDLMKDILSSYTKGKDDVQTNAIVDAFMETILGNYIRSAFKTTGASEALLMNISTSIGEFTTTIDWLTDQINGLRNKEG